VADSADINVGLCSFKFFCHIFLKKLIIFNNEIFLAKNMSIPPWRDSHTLAYSILLTRKLHFSQYTNKCQQQGNSAAGCCQYK